MDININTFYITTQQPPFFSLSSATFFGLGSESLSAPCGDSLSGAFPFPSPVSSTLSSLFSAGTSFFTITSGLISSGFFSGSEGCVAAGAAAAGVVIATTGCSVVAAGAFFSPFFSSSSSSDVDPEADFLSFFSSSSEVVSSVVVGELTEEDDCFAGCASCVSGAFVTWGSVVWGGGCGVISFLIISGCSIGSAD